MARKSSRGGGTAIYISKKFEYEPLLSDSCFHEHILESIIIRVKMDKHNSFILTNSYRPPHDDNLSSFFSLI